MHAPSGEITAEATLRRRAAWSGVNLSTACGLTIADNQMRQEMQNESSLKVRKDEGFIEAAN